MKKLLNLFIALMMPLWGQAAGYDRAKALSLSGGADGSLLMAAAVSEAGSPYEMVLLSGKESTRNWAVSSALKASASIVSAVLWDRPDGGTGVFFATEDGQWFACRYTDGAFSEPVAMGKGRCCGTPIVRRDGRRLLPMLIPGEGVCVMASTDGENWTALGAPVAIPGKVADRDDDPWLVEEADGTLRLYARSCGTAFAWVCSSTDGGATWTAPVKAFQNPDHDFAMQALPEGKTLLVKNCKIDNHVYAQRRGLYAYLSEDAGRLWWGGLCLDASNKVSDPKICVAHGKIYVAFTEGACEESVLKLAVTSYDEIDASTPWLCKPASTVKTVFTAPGAADRMAAELAALKAPRKNWADKTLRVATYNIQYPTNVFPWEKRIDPLVKLIKQYKFDVFGSQEPFLPQIEDMMKHIGDEYDWIGTCINGDNTSRNKHFCPIFYRKDRVELLRTETVYYAEAPKTAGYGAYSERHLIWAQFRDKLTGKEFYIFNSHFDHVGLEAVEISAEILVRTVKEVAAGMPAFLTGDFNTNEDTETYRTIVSSGFLSDSMLAVANAVNSEYFSMSHYKPIDTVRKDGKHIDHIFYTPNSSKVLSWKLILDSYDGAFGSDHLPIMIEWKIAN